jgi:hypothetical protein
MIFSLLRSFLSLPLLGVFIAPSLAQDKVVPPERPQVLVELFSSLNCGACPKANANLIHLSEDPKVMPITWSVSYWDYLGSKDPNARPEFLARQRAYADYFNLRGPYTPQAVIDGCAQNTGLSEKIVASKVSHVEAETDPGVSMKMDRSGVRVSTRIPTRKATVWLAGYQPGITQLTPTKGSNAGKAMDHVNLATSLKPLGEWDGKTVKHFDATCADPACLVIVQESETSEILAIGNMPAHNQFAKG